MKKKKKIIIGYGATAKSTTILNYCRIGKDHIDYFLDTTPDKQNKYTPGSKIIMLHPCLAKFSEMAFPIPLAPPVINAILPSSLFSIIFIP